MACISPRSTRPTTYVDIHLGIVVKTFFLTFLNPRNSRCCPMAEAEDSEDENNEDVLYWMKEWIATRWFYLKRLREPTEKPTGTSR